MHDPLYMHTQEHMEQQAGYTTVTMQNWSRTQEFLFLTFVTQAVHRSLSSPFTVRFAQLQLKF